MKKKSMNLITAVAVLVVLSGAYVGVKTYVAKQEEKENLQQKYDKLYETHGRLKNFIVRKIGKIPFLGRRVLKLMETEVRALPEGKDDTERE